MRTLTSHLRGHRAGFTLIELVLVIIIIGALFLVVGRGIGSFAYWKEETFLQELRELSTFLFSQASADQTHYRLELNEESYRVGTILITDNNCKGGLLGCSLAPFLILSPPKKSQLSAPPLFPSLYELKKAPPSLRFEPSNIDFTPQGIRGSSLVRLKTSRGGHFTIVINPLTGISSIYNYRYES